METHVKHVMFYAALKPSGNMILAELDDGRFCILRNDRPLEGCLWQPSDVVKAVSKYQELKSEALAEKAR
jgi:hypothetical protein